MSTASASSMTCPTCATWSASSAIPWGTTLLCTQPTPPTKSSGELSRGAKFTRAPPFPKTLSLSAACSLAQYKGVLGCLPCIQWPVGNRLIVLHSWPHHTLGYIYSLSEDPGGVVAMRYRGSVIVKCLFLFLYLPFSVFAPRDVCLVGGPGGAQEVCMVCGGGLCMSLSLFANGTEACPNKVLIRYGNSLKEGGIGDEDHNLVAFGYRVKSLTVQLKWRCCMRMYDSTAGSCHPWLESLLYTLYQVILWPGAWRNTHVEGPPFMHTCGCASSMKIGLRIVYGK
jgi:hypothetical protein